MRRMHGCMPGGGGGRAGDSQVVSETSGYMFDELG
jgi:hypothetical protein